MTPKRRSVRSRLAWGLAALGLLAALSGDRAITAAARGIDPLQVLDLEVKPNVIVVLDSSGSMRETPRGGGAQGRSSGDHPYAKLFLAKQVLNSIFTDNANKVNFAFGKYYITDTTATSTMDTKIDDATDNGEQFLYVTRNVESPSMQTTELSLSKEPGYPAGAVSIVTSVNDKLHFNEWISDTTGKYTYADCSITLNPGSYVVSTMATLVAELNSKMAVGAYTCSLQVAPTHTLPNNAAPGNSYSWSFDQVNRRFTVTRGGENEVYQLRFVNDTASGDTNSAGPTLGFTANYPPTTQPGPGNSNMSDTTMKKGATNPAFSTYWTSTAATTGSSVGLAGTGNTAARGFQAWQDIKTAWQVLYFTEGAANCSVNVPTGFYSRGGDLATVIQNLMNSAGACSGLASRNTYAVTYDPSSGRFQFQKTAGPNAVTLRWSVAAGNPIRAALKAGTTDRNLVTSSCGGTASCWQTGDSIRLLRRDTLAPYVQGTSTDGVFRYDEYYDPDGAGTAYGPQNVITYQFLAGRVWNGETFNVESDGTLCSYTTGTLTSPPSFKLQQVTNCSSGTPVGSGPVTFTWAGAQFSGLTSSGVACPGGFDQKTKLGLCQNTTGQLALVKPYLDREIGLADGTGSEPVGWPKGYEERTDGTYGLKTRPANAGIHADGYTPIAASLNEIKVGNATTGVVGFDQLWTTGQASPARAAIKDQLSPRERTIVLFVTDGLDTCAAGGNDRNRALTAAYYAEQLYEKIDATKPESGVTTYMIGFGMSTASRENLDYIAWGGSGLGEIMPTSTPNHLNGLSWNSSWTLADYQVYRNKCTTCVDAYLAPDAETLRSVLQSIINQGATAGEFTAQQSITASLFELVKQVPPVSGMVFDPDNPLTRYEAIVPTLFRSTFTLPSFKGQLKAIQNDGAGNPVLKWEAGAKLRTRVLNSMSSCNDGGLAGECLFSSLVGGRIPRKIYTTTQNGVFGGTNGVTVADLMAGQPPIVQKLLWPPHTDIDPGGQLDAALGLPTTWATLQSQFMACKGTPLNAACTAGTVSEAQREARQMVLAYMAGAQPVLDANGDPKRSPTSGAPYGQILYRTRDWLLADSTMATPVMISPPVDSSPGVQYDTEWTLFRDGPRDVSGVARDGVNMGFGLRNPDKDSTSGAGSSASNPSFKPVMSVIYVGANDMLHAFRAAPSCSSAGTKAASPTDSTCTETGGEELWGFVPFDQVGKLTRLYLYPPTRKDHDYMLAAPLRFADVFVPSPGTAAGNYDTFNTSITGASATNVLDLKGVWRKILLFGRGEGGKYITALDVTAPGAYTKLSTQAQGPIALWSRGNPDTQNGIVGGTNNHDVADATAYEKMGETWSVPAVAWVDKMKTARKSCTANNAPSLPTDPGQLVCKDQSKRDGVEYVAFVGSGYGATGEGTTLFTLDVLTGDVVASATVPAASGTPTGGYANALVASPSTFAPQQFAVTGAPNLAGAKTTRVYVGDLHGRVWKFLAAKPDVPILLKDFGVNQPIATPVTLNLLGTGYAGVFAATGNDLRASWNASDKFKVAGVADIVANDLDTTPPSPTDAALTLFVRDFEEEFRGTVQPASAFATNGPVVFFGGTRFVPPPPLSPLSSQPSAADPTCRSRFDSIIYVLKGETGGAAFNLNATGDDAFVTFDNSKIAAISVVADPRPGAKGASLQVDEGLNKAGAASGAVPPDQGKRPATVGSNGVAFGAIQPSSTICRQ
jgi:hypothetical protein